MQLTSLTLSDTIARKPARLTASRFRRRERIQTRKGQTLLAFPP